ncbi:MAG: Spy/CpxP family protein refolding chaperone [Alphaproteobacteria bacterium]|nr:Spy/CpxP family protein refolding chaperone [Alphaproteobacteria bacterium]
MKLFTIHSGRAIAVAGFIGAALATLPVSNSWAQPSDSPTKTMSPGKAMRDPGDGERKIKEIHDKLRITSAQEELWNNVAQTMRDNAKTFQAGRADMMSRGKTMTVVDSLKLRQGMLEQYSSGLKQLVPQVEALYAVLSPEQKKQADLIMAQHHDKDHRRHYDYK